MIWSILFFTTCLFAESDFSAIHKLDEKINTSLSPSKKIKIESRKFSLPEKIISLNDIQSSGTKYGVIQQGATVRHLESNENVKLNKLTYIKYFIMEDENHFKYIQNKDGTLTWRVRNHFVTPIDEDLALYETPLKYTPAPEKIIKTHYDHKLSIQPELTLYAGKIAGHYMRDLFQDKKASQGQSQQLGLHFFTQWKIPLKAGAVFHYEKSSYELSENGQIFYSSFSFGPQIKTRDFYLFQYPFRLQYQFRYGPFAKVKAETIDGNKNFKFNSSDLMISLEFPLKNQWGDFILGLYLQSQWLNLKDQTQPVKINSSNQTNQSYGLSIAQVFE